MLRPLVPQFVALIPWVLSAIKQGLAAMKTDEADHLTRLNAVIRFCKLLKMAEGLDNTMSAESICFLRTAAVISP